MGKRRRGMGVVSLYGNVAIERGYCPDCESMAFIEKGRLACCGRAYGGKARRIKRETQPEQRRHRPSVDQQREILARQDCRCIYCGQPFGAMHWRDKKLLILTVEWDHDLPFCFSQNNDVSNFVAACQICNGLKSDHLFRGLEDAQAFLAVHRELKGYDF